MSLTQAALPALYGMFVLLCVPPMLSAWVSARRVRHFQRRGGVGWPYVAAMVFSTAAIVFNFGSIFVAGLRLAKETVALGPAHLVAAGLSWLCLWLWVTLLVKRPRNSRPDEY